MGENYKSAKYPGYRSRSESLLTYKKKKFITIQSERLQRLQSLQQEKLPDLQDLLQHWQEEKMCQQDLSKGHYQARKLTHASIMDEVCA